MTGWIVVWVLGVCAVAAIAVNHRYHWAHGWWYDRARAKHLAVPDVVAEAARTLAESEEHRIRHGSMILAEERAWTDLTCPDGDAWCLNARPGEPCCLDQYRPPDWREQTAADLAPEALDILCAGCAGFEHCDGVEGACNCTCGWPENWAELDDSGPGTPAPCPVCGGNRWRTVVKDKFWQCRDCGYERGHRDDSGPGDLSSLTPGPDPDGGGGMPEDAHEPVWPTLSPRPPELTRLADTGDIRDARLLADVTAFMRHHDAEKAEYLAELDAGWAQWWLNFTEALA